MGSFKAPTNKEGPPFGEPSSVLRMVRHKESNHKLTTCF